jgi:hypothetical protein
MAHKQESRMAIKKLSDGPVEMVVSSARLVEGQYGTQVQFVGVEHGADEETLVYVSERSAVRQIERLSLSLDGCSGESLRFEQVQKNGKTYNNIHRANPSGAVAPVAPSNPSAAKVTVSAPAPKTDIFELYATCLSNAAKMTLAMAEETGIEIKGSDVIAAAATLFIQANRR